MTEDLTELEKDKISDGKDLQIKSNVNEKNFSHYNENKEYQRQKEKKFK